MIIGLERGTVNLCEHNPEWLTIANETIDKLKNIFGNIAVDIQHIGSTAIPSIKAKPIIDIAVGVKSLSNAMELQPILEEVGFLYRKRENDQRIFFSCVTIQNQTE